MDDLQKTILKRMDELELLPCPFCGGKAWFFDMPGGWCAVKCRDCGVTNAKKDFFGDNFTFYESYQAAKKAWNKRTDYKK